MKNTNTNAARLNTFRVDTLDAPELRRLENAIARHNGGASLPCSNSNWTWAEGCRLAAFSAVRS